MRDDILDLQNAKRIAIMGGTFDPIHYGHLVTAEAVRHEYNVERVIFIPTGQPAHKMDYAVTHSEHRYLMTVLATVANPFFDVARMEIDRDGATYTIDTIKALRQLCGTHTKIYFITGADAIQQILTWKDADELLKLCSFVAVTRPGYNTALLREQVLRIKHKYETRLHFLEVPALAISSSDIRARIGKGKPVTYLLPEQVERYITKTGLYRDDTDKHLAAAETYVTTHLREARVTHTRGVVTEAEKLARRFGADPQKARLAAWLHDCTRYFDDAEARKICKENGIKLDDVLKNAPVLTHGLTAAVVAAKELGVEDGDVLNAVRYHTLGRPGMSVLEKIIYLADAIEPGREDYPGLADTRRAAETDLDEAVALAMAQSIMYTEKKGGAVHPATADALRDIQWKTKKTKHKTEGRK